MFDNNSRPKSIVISLGKVVKDAAEPNSSFYVARNFDFKKLSTIEKETVLVNAIKQEDMMRFVDMPFDLTGPIIKNFSGHPYAYMEIKGQNIFVACKELKKLNNLLLSSNVIPSSLSKFLQINPQKMILKGTRMTNKGFGRYAIFDNRY